jgi:predicted Zn-dependent protease
MGKTMTNRSGKILALKLKPLFTGLAMLATIAAVSPAAYALRNDDQRSSQSRNSADLRRIESIMAPLVQAADNPDRFAQINVQIVDDAKINAGTSGGGQFLVTTGLLRQFNDNELRGVLAHEIAHEDLGHPVKQQLVNAGLSIGVALLERVFPGSGNLTPVAGNIIAANYSRPQELAADRHAVTILNRAGYSKQTMIDALTRIIAVEGNSGGGFISTHPATDERIRALQQL